MIKFAIVVFLFPAICNGLECVFHTDPVHPVNPRFQDRNVSGVKQYECSAGDRYCVYFEGNLETTGRNQTFSVRACEGDLMHYVNPIGEAIGHTLSVKCHKDGIVEKKVGAFTYRINCCIEPDCDIVGFNSAAKSLISIAFVFVLALIGVLTI